MSKWGRYPRAKGLLADGVQGVEAAAIHNFHALFGEVSDKGGVAVLGNIRGEFGFELDEQIGTLRDFLFRRERQDNEEKQKCDFPDHTVDLYPIANSDPVPSHQHEPPEKSVEIGLLRTVILETGNWTDTGHPTGRKVAFVNSFAIEGHYFNFSTAGQWLWDELQVVVGQVENPYPLVEAIQHLVEEETRGSVAKAEQEWQKSTAYRKPLTVSPAIHLRPTGGGVELQIRYVTSANERYVTRSKLYEKIVALLRGEAKPQVTAANPKA